MIDISQMHFDSLIEAKERIRGKYGDKIVFYNNEELSKNLLRESLDRHSVNSINAHLQALNYQLTKIIENEGVHLKTNSVYLAFSKGITLFDRLTDAIEMDGNVFGDNFIVSQSLYLDAISSFTKNVTNFHQGDLNFSYIPMKLRLAIEFYFKNMIGYVGAKKHI